MSAPEFQLQKSICQRLDLCYPSLLYWSVPSGAVLAWRDEDRAKAKREWSKLRVSGAKVGVPDLMILHDGRLLCIEVKSPAGRVSDEQRLFADRLVAAGGHWAMIRDIDHLDTLLSSWGILRARSAA